MSTRLPSSGRDAISAAILASAVLLSACGSDDPSSPRDVRSDDDITDVDIGVLDTDEDPATDVADAPDTTDVVDVTDAADAADATDATDAADVTDAADTTDATDAVDAPDVADAADAIDAADTTDATDAPDVAPDTTVDWCRLEFPARIAAGVGTERTVTGLVRELGVTDLTERTDVSESLAAELGWGADGSTPDDGWTWVSAASDTAWTDADGTDAYVGQLVVPAAGDWDYAFRFARADGAWLYCDLDRGPGSDGSEDGYDPADAGELVAIDPCDVFGACGTRPPDTCADGGTRTRYDEVPLCESDGPDAECSWPSSDVACADDEVCRGGACVPDRVEIAWCRLNHPVLAEPAPDAEFDVYGRIRVPGVTERSPSVDADEHIIVQAGWGPDGSDPATAFGAWTWSDAAPNDAWDGVGAGEPDVDEWIAAVTAPSSPGGYDLAVRVSGDRGTTWTHCDVDAGPGSDGSEDGYNPANAATMQVTIPGSVCEPNPCTMPPARTCDDDVVIGIGGTGVCSVVGEVPACSFEPTVIDDCGARDWICADAACVSGLDTPPPGGLVITELMAGDDTNGPWFEVANPGGAAYDLLGCRFVGAGTATTVLSSVVVAEAAPVVVARDPGAPGLVDAVAFPGLEFGDAAGFLYVECDGEIVDLVSWEAGDVVPGVSLQLAAAATTAADNDWPVHWCPSEAAYADALLGSPGAANAACPDRSRSIDWCRLQWPVAEEVDEASPLNVYGRIYSAGLTDATDAVDTDRFVVAEVGVGPDGSDPSDGWTWFPTMPNPGWDATASGSPNNDEYEGQISAPLAANSPYDFAVRFSGDGGLTWTYCDRDLGDGSDGSEDGYSASAAGALTVRPPTDPCDPNPCVAPPAGTCAGTLASRVVEAGTCTAVDPPLCDYTPLTVDCGVDGGICEGGVCVFAPPVSVDWCRLQWPVEVTASPDEEWTAYARLWAPGVTDVTRGVDRYPAIVAQVGVGPESRLPEDAPLAWSWWDAEPNTAYDGVAAGEPSNDEYQASLSLPESGAYSLAARFSGDNGRTWIYCDGGAAGSADGYQPSAAGSVTIRD